MKPEEVEWDISVGKSSKPGRFHRVTKSIRVKVTHKPTGMSAEQEFIGVLTKLQTKAKTHVLKCHCYLELEKKVKGNK